MPALIGRLVYFLKDFAVYLAVIISSFLIFVAFVFSTFRAKEKKTFHKAFLAFGFSLFVFIFIFSLFEGYFRYVYDKSDTLGFLKVNQKWTQRHVTYTNYKQYFFRTKPFSFEKPADIIRIGVMGDSLAFGAGIKDPANRFSDILEKKLNDAGYKVQVINFAIPGYDTYGEIQIYNNIKDLKFDVLVWSYFLNDIEDAGGQSSSGSPILAKSSQRAKMIETISNFSYFFDYVYWRFTSTHQTTINELSRVDLDSYRNPDKLSLHYRDMSGFLAELKDDKVVPVTLIFPYFALIGPNYPAYDIHQNLDKFFTDNGVSTIDLIGDLKDKKARSLWASNFDPHPNEYVHSLAADRLFEKIVPIIKEIQREKQN